MYLKKARLFLTVCALVLSVFQLGIVMPEVVAVNDFRPNVLVSWNPQALDQRNSSIAVGPDGVIHVVWTHETVLGDTDVYYAKSIDGGMTFVGHKPVHEASDQFQSMPDIAVSSNGWIHVVWSDSRPGAPEWQTNFIYYARSTDGGDSFDEDVEKAIGDAVGYPGETTVMVQSHPSLDVDDDSVCTVHVAWNLIEEPVSVLWGLDYDNSEDCGDNFGTDVRVVPDGYTPSIAVDSTGNPHIGYRSISNEIKHIKSSDGGSNWGSSTTVNDDPGHGGHFEPDIAIDVFDYIHMAWTDTRAMVPGPAENNRDIYYSRSTNGGVSFEMNLLVNNYDYYPGGSSFPGQFNPTIGVDDNGNPHVAFADFREDIDGWFTDDPNNRDDVNIYYANSVDGGQTFMTDNWRVNDEDMMNQPKLSPSVYVVGYTGQTSGVHITWDDARDYAIYEVDIYYSGSVLTQPELDWCGDPGKYETDGVDPDVGHEDTVFVYCVKYTDADNDPPALGRPVVRIDDGSSVSEYEMTLDSFVSQQNRYDLGARYEFETTLTPGLPYQYEFYVMDSFGLEDSLSGVGPEVYHRPVLDWCQKENWIDTGVDPEVGTTSTEFVYCIKYSQAESLAPEWVKAHIYDGGVEIQPGGFEMQPSDFVIPGPDDYADGRYYIHPQYLPAGTDYSYDFEAKLPQGQIYSGLFPPTGPKPGPEVYDHPILIWCDEPGFITDGVDPDDGRPDETVFTYCVKYIQDGGIPPDSGYPELRIYDGDLQNPVYVHEMQYQYGLPNVGGAVYKFSRTLPLPTGGYYYDFYVEVDYIGVAEVFPSTPKAGPDVYYIPVLSWCQEAGYFDDGVDPDEGTTESEFDYCVVYTHPGDVDPEDFHPLVYIYEESEPNPTYIESMTEVSGDNLNGRMYKLYNKQLPEAGVWMYKFRAIDKNGHWAEDLPPTPKDGPTVYTHPVLEWCGDPGTYETDGVDPDEGEPGTTFTWCIEYFQNEDIWPDGNAVSVWIYDGGDLQNPVYTDTMIMQSGTNPQTGLRFESSRSLQKTANGWYYDFHVSILNGIAEEIYPEPPKPGPDVYYKPQLSWCGDIGKYETDGVDPDEGSILTEFEYCVKYSHPDGIEPLETKVKIFKGGQMEHEDVMTCEAGDPTAGVKCHSTRILGVAGTDWSYQFSAKDQNGREANPLPDPDPKDGPIVYNIPVLDWCGDAGIYENDGVDPDRGSSGDTFTYCVKYSHGDGTEPTGAGYVRVKIFKWDVLEYTDDMQYISGDHMTGARYMSSRQLDHAKWSYQFIAKDSRGYDSLPLPDPDPKDGPLVNNAPTLDWCGDAGIYDSDGVDPDYGIVGTTFTFCVLYTDLDNDAPTYIKARVFDGSWTEYDMSEQDPGDTDYSDGKVYIYSTNTLSVGDHKHEFKASDGIEDASTPWVWGPFVYTTARGPWWKFHHDLENTGYTAESSPNLGELDWSKYTGYTTESSPVIDEYDRLFIGDTKPKKLWAFNILGTTPAERQLWSEPLQLDAQPHDAPAAVNGRVYVGTGWANEAIPDEGYFYVVTHWGEERYKFTLGEGIRGSSPTVFDNKIVFGTLMGKVHCISELDFSTEWTFTAASAPGEHFRTSPAVYTDPSNGDKTIYINSNMHLYGIPAVDPNDDGTISWSEATLKYQYNYNSATISYSSPVLLTGGYDMVVAGSGNAVPHGLFAFSLPDHDYEWHQGMPGSPQALGGPVQSSAAYHSDLYVGSDWSNGDGSPIYRLNTGGGIIQMIFTGHEMIYRSSPAISGNKVFVLAGGYLVALNWRPPAGGPYVLWESDRLSGVQFGSGSSPAIFAGKVYVGDHKADPGGSYKMLYCFKQES